MNTNDKFKLLQLPLLLQSTILWIQKDLYLQNFGELYSAGTNLDILRSRLVSKDQTATTTVAREDMRLVIENLWIDQKLKHVIHAVSSFKLCTGVKTFIWMMVKAKAYIREWRSP